ncbi:hypothetical protein K439DRAFT_1655220 [Ramaria rubella]|nr:hypothetical protein K439DRAFT_1655220 [Ramaria rubella]
MLSVSPKTYCNDSSGREVFLKTLAFYCAIIEHGCPFSAQSHSERGEERTHHYGLPSQIPQTLNEESEAESDSNSDNYEHTRGHKAHLILCNLNEFNIEYLQALLQNDAESVAKHEINAKQAGYGPLASCNFVAAPHEQKTLCHELKAMWHRTADGVLMCGTLNRTKSCPARFKFYYPYDLERCPSILLVCRNPHLHPDPFPATTPQTVVEIFTDLLTHLDWKLADATPCRILLNSSFMAGLRRVLGWVLLRDPVLSDLHPSLGNSDHTAQLINKLWYRRYPHGTGFEGAYHLLTEHRELPPDDQYVRCVEKHDIPGEGTFSLIICMFRRMSALLSLTKQPSIDTSFKRLNNWQEFEIEAWFPEYLRCQIVRFRHIHGEGFDSVVADGHRGQGLGLGLYCQKICVNMAGYCSIEWNKALHALTPYEHLARFYRYCFAHFTRNVTGLRIAPKIRNAMMSLALAEPLPDLEGTLRLICTGGKKAADWLKDKEAASGFSLAAIYQPASKIPLDVWKASPSTSNGNEQAHRNINQDGMKLAVLAGVMRGMQYDSRAMCGLKVLHKHGIHTQDQHATHFRQAARIVVRTAAVQKRTVNGHDADILSSYQQILRLQADIQTQTTVLKRALDSGIGVEQARKKLRVIDTKLHTQHADLAKRRSNGSGAVLMPDLKEPTNMLDRQILSDTFPGPIRPQLERRSNIHSFIPECYCPYYLSPSAP